MKHKFVWVMIFWTTITWAASHHPQAFLDRISGQPGEGQAIVRHFCSICHASHPLIPLGAPRKGYAKDWAPRLKQGKKQIFKHLADGFNAMPARGGCFECTDEQLQKAIDYLIESSP